MSISELESKQARTPRLFISCELSDLALPATVELPKKSAHHLVTVQRARDGEHIQVFNGDGKNYSAHLVIEDKKVTARITSFHVNNSESPIKTQLVQSISRGDRMDTSVQKSVELGVNEIQPVYSRHSIPVLKGDRAAKKLEHWQSIAASAAEQSGRSVIPLIHPPISLGNWLQNAWLTLKNANAVGWVLDPLAPQNLNFALQKELNSQDLYVCLIGPETGFTPQEMESTYKQGFTGITFGPRVLRTETAGPAILAALQTLRGDLLG